MRSPFWIWRWREQYHVELVTSVCGNFKSWHVFNSNPMCPVLVSEVLYIPEVSFYTDTFKVQIFCSFERWPFVFESATHLWGGRGGQGVPFSLFPPVLPFSPPLLSFLPSLLPPLSPFSPLSLPFSPFSLPFSPCPPPHLWVLCIFEGKVFTKSTECRNRKMNFICNLEIM